MHARGESAPGDDFVHESLLGMVRLDDRVAHDSGRHPAVVPGIAGQAWITDVSMVGVDPTDAFPQGYTLSDSWMQAPSPEDLLAVQTSDRRVHRAVVPTLGPCDLTVGTPRQSYGEQLALARVLVAS